MIRSVLYDLNHVELKYYRFIISLDKCTGSCNVLFQNISVAKQTKDTNVKAFNMIKQK